MDKVDRALMLIATSASILLIAGSQMINYMTAMPAFGAMSYGGNDTRGNSMMSQNELQSNLHVAAGRIANVQLDSSGQPTWIESGIWVARASFNESSGEPLSIWLIAKFAMIKPDGTAKHVHSIFGFQPSAFSMEQNGTIHVVGGTASVSMKDGPVSSVPITVKIFNGSVIGFWIGPDKVDNHFGSGPIYGILSDHSMSMMAMMKDMNFEIGENKNTEEPKMSPSNFLAGVNNPFLTLTPGKTYTYETKTDDGNEKNVVIVTNETKVIQGITAMVVWDRVWDEDNELTEETFDWYAQDKEGNVWYLGEDSKEYDDGNVSNEGSWEAGVDGAEAGIIMEANPQIGDSYRQEYYKGHAEDMGDVISLNASVTVPFGTFTECLETRDWSALEKSANEHKFYCKDVGNVVLEDAPDERNELIKVE